MPLCPDCGEFHDDGEDEFSSSSDLDDGWPDYWTDAEYMMSSEEDEDDMSMDEGNILPIFMPPLMPLMNPGFFPFSFFQFRMLQQMMGIYGEIERQQRKKKRDELWHRKKQLASIQKFEYSKKECGNDECCVICLMDYEEGSGMARLKCNHHYHEECIKKWVLKTGKCPLCMTKVLSSLAESEKSKRLAWRLRRNAHQRVWSRKSREEERKRYKTWRHALVTKEKMEKVRQEKRKQRVETVARRRRK